jgi:hypothetical protein
MMKMRLIVVAMEILLLAGAAWPVPTVYLEPIAVEVEQGQDFTISVEVDAGADTLTCFLVEFAFDASVIELLSAEEGSLFAESGHPTMFNWDQHSPGLHSCNDVTFGFDAFVTCPGELVLLTFHAVASGVTPLSITVVDLRDIRRDPIQPVLTEGGLVGVGPGAGIADGGQDVPDPVLQCYPNPFSQQTSFEFRSCGAAGEVDVTVYSLTGRMVARPAVAESGPGLGFGRWNGAADDGHRLPGGVYFVVASGPNGRARARITLVR